MKSEGSQDSSQLQSTLTYSSPQLHGEGMPTTLHFSCKEVNFPEITGGTKMRTWAPEHTITTRAPSTFQGTSLDPRVQRSWGGAKVKGGRRGEKVHLMGTGKWSSLGKTRDQE